MKQSLQMVIGTTSKHKVDALKEACASLGITVDIEGAKTDSGQNEQPEGFEEGYAGAFSRAQSAQQQHPGCIGVGIENFIISFSAGAGIKTLDIACVVILCRGGYEIVATSQGVVFPECYVEEARKRGFETTTVGSVIAEKTGCDGTDPHSYLTNNLVPRKETLVSALRMVLSQLLE